MREEMLTYRYGNSDAPVILIQMVGDHELPGIENEIREIRRLTDQEFAFVAVKVGNWNQDLSPWKASAVFGKEEFGDGAARTLKEVLNICTDGRTLCPVGSHADRSLQRCRSNISLGLVSGIPGRYEEPAGRK